MRAKSSVTRGLRKARPLFELTADYPHSQKEAAMAKIQILAGDLTNGKGTLMFNAITFPLTNGDGFSQGKTLVLTGLLESISLASEEAVKRTGGTIGWGVAVAPLLGPVGLLAGLLLGGKGTDVTFIAQFKDGRKMLATTDVKSFTKLQVLVFRLKSLTESSLTRGVFCCQP